MIYGPVLSCERRRGVGKSWGRHEKGDGQEINGWWELGTLASLGKLCETDGKHSRKLGVQQGEVVSRSE